MPRCLAISLPLTLLALGSGCTGASKPSTPETGELAQPAVLPGTPPTTKGSVGAPTVDLGLPAQPGPKDAKRIIETVWRNLDRAGHVCERHHDYGPGGGIRTFGCRLLSLVSYRSLSQIAGVPVFRAGPHSPDSLDLDNSTDFGRYHPAFIQWSVDNLIPAASNPSLGIATRPLYEKYVRPLARLSFLIWLERNRDPDRFARLLKSYEDQLRLGDPIRASYDSYTDFMVFSPFGRFAAERAVETDELVVSTTTGFWIRRTIDHTATALAVGLKQLLAVYDGDFLRQAQAFAKDPPAVDEEEGGGMEEEYHDEFEDGFAGDLPEPQPEPTVSGDRIRDAWLGLGATRNTCKDEFNYFPHGGMRIFACHMFSLLPYAELAKVAGVSPFVSGPHTDSRLALTDKTLFGHYNPAFVRWATDHLVPGTTDDEWRQRTQDLYDQKVRPLARTFMLVWRDIQRRPERFAEEVDGFTGGLRTGSLDSMWYESYYDYLEGQGSAGFEPDGNVVKTCVAFWIRRHVDGTAQDLARGLEKLMKAYDPAF